MHFWTNMARILAPKIKKNGQWRFQQASKNWSIFGSIFYRFLLRFGSQFGSMLATLFGPRRSKTGQEARLAAMFEGPLSLLKRPRASRQGTRWARELPRQGTRWAREFFGMILGCFLVEFWPMLVLFFALSDGQQSCDLAIALGPKKEQKSKKI